MDPNTGNIYKFETPAEADEAKRRGFVPISQDELPAVQGMNRKQRRAWAAQQRKKAGST